MKGIVIPTILVTAVAVASTAAFANRGGQAASHMSSQGVVNSNGPHSMDRDKGLDRAADRRSPQGLAHEKATTHATKHHGKRASYTTR
jgi:hypothetical protein